MPTLMTSPNPPRPIHDKISKSNNNLDWPGVAGSENWTFERVSSSGLLLLDRVFLSWLWSLLTPTLSSRMGSLIQSCNEDFCRALWRTYYRGECCMTNDNASMITGVQEITVFTRSSSYGNMAKGCKAQWAFCGGNNLVRASLWGNNWQK